MQQYDDLKDQTLDPEDWETMRKLGHRMIDDMMDYLRDVRDRPVWQPFPDSSKNFLSTDIPEKGMDPESIYHEFQQHILPFTKGNIHPRFWAWVQGTGTPLAALADMLASAMNPNVTIGEQSAMYVDQQVLSWCRQMMGFPKNASGMLVSGGSVANLTALIVARNNKSTNSREKGLKAKDKQLILYCSAQTHSCIDKAVSIIGIGTANIRKIQTNASWQIDIDALTSQIQKDIDNGFEPFCIVGNAGTVNTGAIDPLDEILEISKRYNLWFHVDGAFGALALLSPDYKNKLQAISKADSVAFDLHKWMYLPYEVGCVLIRDKVIHRDAFAITPDYLLQHDRGLAAGPDSYNNFSIELSRGFKALKVWMSIKEHGVDKLGQLIHQNILQARYLAELLVKKEQLELLAPVTLNIVCYRFVVPEWDEIAVNELNKEICMQLQEQGIASPSSTILHGKYAIRVAITNHRSRKEDFEILIKESLRIGNECLLNPIFSNSINSAKHV